MTYKSMTMKDGLKTFIFLITVLGVVFQPGLTRAEEGAAENLFEELSKYDVVLPKVWFGGQFASVPEEKAKDMNLAKSYGVLVQNIVPKSPAEKAGLLAGDVILESNGNRLYDRTDIPKIVKMASVGDIMDLKVLRGKNEIQVKVTLEIFTENSSPELLVAFLSENVNSLYSKGEINKAIEVLELTKLTQKRYFGEYNSGYLDLVSSLFYVRTNIKDYTKAKENLLEGIKVVSVLYGEMSKETAGAHQTAALFFEKIEKYDEAEKHIKESISIKRSLFGTDDLQYLESLHDYAIFLKKRDAEFNISNIYSDIPEFYNAMVGYLEQIDSVGVREVGERALELTRIDPVRAWYFLKKQLASQKKIMSEDSQNYPWYLINQAHMHVIKNQYDKARSIYKSALDVLRVRYGKTHSYYIKAALNEPFLDYIKLANGDPDLEFEKIMEEAFTSLRRTHQDKTIIYAELLDEMAAYHENLNTANYNENQKENLFAKIANLRKESRNLRREVLGANSLEFARYLTKSMQLSAYMNSKVDWKGRFKEGMSIQKKILGENHPVYARSMVNYADGVLAYQKDIQQDVKLAKKVMEERLNIYQTSINTFMRTIGKTNSYFLYTLKSYSEALYSAAYLGGSLLAAGTSNVDIHVMENTRDEAKFQQSRQLSQLTVGLSEAVLGVKHPQYLTNFALTGCADLDERIKYASEAVDIYSKIFGDQHWQYAGSLSTLSGFYKQRYLKNGNEQDLKNAEELIQHSIKFYRNIYGSNNPLFANNLEGMATFYKEIDKSKAKEIYHHVFDLLKNTLGESDKRYTYALLRYSGLFLDPSDPDYIEGINVYTELIKSIENNLGKDSQLYSKSIATLAWLYDTTAQFDKAEAIRAKIVSEKDQKQNRIAETYELVRSLNTNILMGEYGKAKETLLGILSDISDEQLLKESLTYAQAQAYLADIYYLEEDYDSSLEYHKKYFDTLKRSFKNIDIYNMKAFGSEYHFGLARNYHALGDLKKADQHYRKIIEIEGINSQSTINNPTTAKYLLGLARLLADTGNLKEAEQYNKKGLEIYQQSFDDSHPEVINASIQLANIYTAWEKPQAAFLYYLKGLEAQEQFVADMSLWAPDARLQSYIESVARNYDRFYTLLADDLTEGTDEILSQAFEIHLNHKEKATEYLSTRNRLALYSKDEETLRLIDELKDVVKEISLLALSGVPAGSTPKAYQKKISRLSKKKENLEQSIAERSSEYSDKKSSAKVTTEKVASVLAPGESYLDYVEFRKYDYKTKRFTDKNRYLRFMLSRSASNDVKIEIKDIGEADLIDQMVSSMRKKLNNTSNLNRGVGGIRDNDQAKFDLNIAHQLNDVLFGSLEDVISQAKALYIAPTGNLNLIPFEVLSPKEKSQYLCDRIPVIYTLGRDLYASKSKQGARTKTTETVMVIAAPNYSKSQTSTNNSDQKKSDSSFKILSRGTVHGWPIRFDPLPGTLKEANSILNLAEGKSVVNLVKEQATEENVKAALHPKLLHIATHGFFLENTEAISQRDTRGAGGVGLAGAASAFYEAPLLKGTGEQNDPLLRSGLALSGANYLYDEIAIPAGNEDGILTAAEVTGMDLYGTELVVLSACETGVGDINRSNGISGLRRAFKIAGAQNIIMSLWSVPDQETVWLMENFYTHYFAGDKPHIALNKARAGLRKRLIDRDGYDHPFYWAAFIIEGGSR